MLMFQFKQGRANRLIWLFFAMLIALCTGMPMQAYANEPRQFYFVAKTGPQGSPGVDTSLVSSAEKVVYLRFGIIEGALPDDVSRLELRRNGQVIFNQAVDALMSPSEIQALYQGEHQEQRLLTTVSRLQEQALADGASFSPSQFGTYLHQRLRDDSAFAFLAARHDFNIARARYRAVIDRPGSGVFNYELRALNNAGDSARLGLLSLDTAQQQRVLAPSDFKQVMQGRCDAPEFAKDHYSVALGWQSPGVSNVTDRFASEVFIAGYDLYRANENLPDSELEAPALNLQQLALEARLDGRGNPQITGLSKVNDLPIMVNGANDGQAEWLETYDQLSSAGIQPGDRRAYYLVARDFAGHYGDTQATVVTVPNLIRPATPWDVSLFAKEDNNRMRISFDTVNVENYLEVFGRSRKICNLDTVASSGVVEYVGKQQDCNTDTLRRLRLDVTGYRVYRFDSFDAASGFQDSDGDGVSDRDEADLNSQCDSSVQPAGAANYQVRGAGLEINEVRLANSGRKRQRLADNTPGDNKDAVYWYRLASLTADGRSSLLSAPVRALFPNRQLPEKPSVIVGRPGRVPCGCEIEYTNSNRTWDFSNSLGGDFNLSCASSRFENINRADLNLGKGQPGQCRNQELSKNCLNQLGRTIDFSGQVDGRTLKCGATIPDEIEFCSKGSMRLKPSYCDAPVNIDNSFLVPGPLDVVVKPNDEGSCVSLYQDINGQATRLGTTCGTEETDLNYQLESGFFCAYAVSQDQNNNISQTEVLPCILVRPDNDKELSTPQPVSLKLEDSYADIAWRLPLEPVAVTLVRLSQTLNDGRTVRQVESFPSAGLGAAKVVRKRLDIDSLVGESDRFCVQYRAIGPARADLPAKQSDWSNPLCSERSSLSQALPEYLPWPVQAPLAQSSDVLNARLGAEFLDEPRFGPESTGIFLDMPYIRAWQELDRKCVIESTQVINETEIPKLFLGMQCNEQGRSIVDSAVEGAGRFMVYRQARGFTTFAGGQVGSATPTPGGSAEGEWVQVSPLIEFAHWDRIENPSGEAVKINAKYRLADPYYHVYRASDEGDLRLAFWDRYPFTVGESYRYQIVLFNNNMKPISWRRSAWLEATFNNPRSADIR